MLQNEDFCNRHPEDVKIHTDEAGRNIERFPSSTGMNLKLNVELIWILTLFDNFAQTPKQVYKLLIVINI